MTRYVAGVDGGQSSTTAVVAAATSGTELGRGAGPPADLVGEPAGSRRQIEAVAAAVRDALGRAGLPETTPLAAIVVGLTGHEGAADALALPFDGARVRVVHDSIAAHAGALAGGPGIVTIAGTGSVVLGTDRAGGRARAGGWGFLFGDEGGAFDLGRATVARAMRRADRGDASACGELARAHFGVADLREIQQGFAAGTISRPSIAALASGTLALAASGDADARSILATAVRGLAGSVEAVHRRLAPAAPRDLSYAGGLFRSETFRAAFAAALTTTLGSEAFRLIAPRGDGATGALTLARDGAAGAPA